MGPFQALRTLEGGDRVEVEEDEKKDRPSRKTAAEDEPDEAVESPAEEAPEETDE
jgi:hypothetical protein